MPALIVLALALSPLASAQEFFSGIGPFEVKKVISFQAPTGDGNGSGVFRVKTSEGFLKTLTCTLPQGSRTPVKRVKILERDPSRPGTVVYFCLGLPE